MHVNKTTSTNVYTTKVLRVHSVTQRRLVPCLCEFCFYLWILFLLYMYDCIAMCSHKLSWMCECLHFFWIANFWVVEAIIRMLIFLKDNELWFSSKIFFATYTLGLHNVGDKLEHVTAISTTKRFWFFLFLCQKKNAEVTKNFYLKRATIVKKNLLVWEKKKVIEQYGKSCMHSDDVLLYEFVLHHSFSEYRFHNVHL